MLADTPERAFVLTGLPLGVLLLLLTPPFQIPDEPQHFYRAFQVSELGFLAPVALNEATYWGGRMPKSLAALVDASDVAVTRFRPENKVTPSKVLATLRAPLNADDREYLPVAPYSPLPYLPQAAGIAAGRLLGLSPLLLFYLGRLCALGAWVGLVFLAIKSTPLLKWTYFLLALMPMTLSLAASYSPDSVTIGVAFLLTARLLSWAHDAAKPTVGLGDRAGLLALALALTLAKIPYLPLLSLFLLVPPRKLGGKTRYVLTFAAVVIACIAASWAWSGLAHSTMTGGPTVDMARHGVARSPLPDVSPTRQLGFILSHPVAFARVLATTVTAHGRGYLVGFVGALGWLETRLPVWLPYLYVLVLIAVSWLDGPRERVSWATKGFALGICGLTFLGALTALYTAYSSVGMSTVEGFQGRYLIPIAPLFFLVFCTEHARWRVTNAVAAALILFVVLSTSLAGYRLIHRFYVVW